jgi:CheY-like chemotaxis protein
MPTIGIVDDRRVLRTTLRRTLSAVLPDEWDSIDSEPLPELNLYPSWITENEISALIVDERLHEQAADVEGHVTYSGHDLVDFLRERFPTIPIFIVTSYIEDDPLKSRFKDVEGIFPRGLFVTEAENYVPIILRASQRFIETYQRELSELSEIAMKIAKGEATQEDQERGRAIQNKIETAFAIDEISSKSEWLDKLDATLSEFQQLKSEIEDHLSEQGSHEMDKGE